NCSGPERVLVGVLHNETVSDLDGKTYGRRKPFSLHRPIDLHEWVPARSRDAWHKAEGIENCNAHPLAADAIAPRPGASRHRARDLSFGIDDERRALLKTQESHQKRSLATTSTGDHCEMPLASDSNRLIPTKAERPKASQIDVPRPVEQRQRFEKAAPP